MLNVTFGTSAILRLRAASGTVVSVAALAWTLSAGAQLPTLDVSKQASQTSTPASTAPKSDSNTSAKPPDVPVPIKSSRNSAIANWSSKRSATTTPTRRHSSSRPSTSTADPTANTA